MTGLTFPSSRDPKQPLHLVIQPVDQFLDSIGVQAHLNGRCEQDFDLMEKAGIRHVRDELRWDWLELEQGKLHLPQGRQEWIDEAVARGMDILVILNYGNPVYPDEGIGCTERPQEVFELYGQYVEFVVSALKDKVKRWEIWNEPNCFTMNAQYGGDWRGGGWVDAYARLADQTVKRIRKIDSDAMVMTTGIEPYMADLFLPLLKEKYDAIAVHPYTHPLPTEFSWQSLRNLEKVAKQCDHDLPFIVTEQGYPAIGGEGKFMWAHSSTMTQVDQARHLLRLYCSNFLIGIPQTYWYDLVCDGTDESEQEHNFGLSDFETKEPRPAWYALRNLTKGLSDKGDPVAAPAEQVVGREVKIEFDETPSDPVRAMLFARDAATYYMVLWKESHSRDRLVAGGKDARLRVFHDDGAPEKLTMRYTPFSCGRPYVTEVDPVPGGGGEGELVCYSDGLHHLLEVTVRESPVILQFRHK